MTGWPYLKAAHFIRHTVPSRLGNRKGAGLCVGLKHLGPQSVQLLQGQTEPFFGGFMISDHSLFLLGALLLFLCRYVCVCELLSCI